MTQQTQEALAPEQVSQIARQLHDVIKEMDRLQARVLGIANRLGGAPPDSD